MDRFDVLIIGGGPTAITIGASPVLSPVAGHDLNGVMTFKTEEDLKKISEGNS